MGKNVFLSKFIKLFLGLFCLLIIQVTVLFITVGNQENCLGLRLIKIWIFFECVMDFFKIPNIYLQYVINQRSMMEIALDVVGKLYNDQFKDGKCIMPKAHEAKEVEEEECAMNKVIIEPLELQRDIYSYTYFKFVRD